jgi:hypothetical protein
MDSDPSEPPQLQEYRQREAHFSGEINRLETTSRRYSNLRLAIFLIGIASVVLIPKSGVFWILSSAAFLLFLAVAFVAAAVRHQTVEDRLHESREMARRNGEGAARVARDWKHLPNRLVPAELAFKSLAVDLDLFGRASLFQLVCTANTWEGRNSLAQALVDGIDPHSLKGRQAAIQELAPKLGFRQLLECATVPLRDFAGPSDALFTPLQVDSTRLRQRLRRWFCVASPLGVISLVALNLAGLVPTWPCGMLIVLNFVASLWWGRKIRKDLKSAISADQAVGHFIHAFRRVAAESLSSPDLVILQGLSKEALNKMRRLESLVSLSRLPSLPIPGFGLCLNLLLLWNLHLAMAFEKWWKENGENFSRWLRSVGNLEAICSFASLLHDNPKWCFPHFATDDRIVAEGLGHPMIPETMRIDNEVSVGPRGRILMVTGSNMSGKTTLLRAIGINVLLAKAGGPVCSESLELPWVQVVTSMRATDSVTDGVSLFMAELASIKAVVAAAQRATHEGAGLVLYLLDEVLLGTNIDERQVITRRLIQNLLHQRAIGAMSTHDLSLLHYAELASSCDKIHFRETFVTSNGKLEMTFDYRIRAGEAESRNAVALLRHIDLESL